MKKLPYALILLLLASCSSPNTEINTATNNQATAMSSYTEVIKLNPAEIERVTLDLNESFASTSEAGSTSKPFGFFLSGRMPDGSDITLGYFGSVKGITSNDSNLDVDSVDDVLLKKLNPTNGRFDVSYKGALIKSPSPDAVTAFGKAVKKALDLKPKGKNSEDQTITLFLDYALRIINTQGTK